jgi:hypothetical protein
MHHPSDIGMPEHRLGIHWPTGGCKKTVLAFENLAGARKADARQIGGEQA